MLFFSMSMPDVATGEVAQDSVPTAQAPQWLMSGCTSIFIAYSFAFVPSLILSCMAGRGKSKRSQHCAIAHAPPQGPSLP